MLKNMKIKRGLLLGFGVAVLSALVIIVISFSAMVNMKSQYEVLLNEDAEANQDILNCRVSALIPGRNIRDALLVPDSEANQGLIDEAEQYLVKLEQNLALLDQHFPHQLDRALLHDYQNAARTWANNAPKLIEMYENYRSTGNAKYLEDAENFIYEVDTPLQTQMGNAATALDNYLVQGMMEERGRIEKFVGIVFIVIIVLSLAAVVCIIQVGAALIKSITVPTAQVHQALIGFSRGDLDIPVEFESENELGDMCQALRESQQILGAVIKDTNYLLSEMANGNFDVKTRAEDKYVGELSGLLKSVRLINSKLSNAIEGIRQSSEQVAAGADQVAAGSQALAQGATEQASSVEELSAMISDISNGAVSITNAAKEVHSSIGTASEQITIANDNVRALNHAMDGIKNSSGEIAKIIAVIENIAFQTNILALNAAVEAARAGAAGKGFAVVANEVRDLATKSAEASKNTSALIERSIKSVENGTHIADETAKALMKAVQGAQEATEIVNEISEASARQASAIAQITLGIEQISSVVQSNSATSEESAAASQELSSQANVLKKLVSSVRLKEENRPYENAYNSYDFDTNEQHTTMIGGKY